MLTNVKKYIKGLFTKTKVVTKAFRVGFGRAYHAAKTSRLEVGWIQAPTSIIEDLKAGLKTLRARSRESCQNNDYSKRWLCLLEENIIGDSGIILQSKVNRANGRLNEPAVAAIEAAWKAWGKKGMCDVTGQLSWVDCQKLWIKSTARDGETLVRLIRGADNGFGFALQFLEIDRLDEAHSETLSNGNTVSMGVERDAFLKPVAYHLRTIGLTDGGRFSPVGPVERIPADEIIHAGIQDRADQPRFAPWNAAALIRLQYLSGYEEAEIVAARSASCKMGFLEQAMDATQEYGGDSTDVQGHPTIEAEPGSFPSLPPGYHMNAWNPDHPTTAFKDFMKAVLRGISSGLNMSYNALTSDLEGVSFSSLRAGELKERDSYRSGQRFVIDHFCDPVFEAWLMMAAFSKAIPVPADNIPAASAHAWQPRGWPWVDPLKDINANILAIKNGLGSRSMFLAERGLQFEDILAQLAKEQEMATAAGLTLTEPVAPAPTPQEDEDEDDDEDQPGRAIEHALIERNFS